MLSTKCILQKMLFIGFQNLTKVNLMIGIKINSRLIKTNKIIEFGIQNKLHHSEDNIKSGFADLQILQRRYRKIYF